MKNHPSSALSAASLIIALPVLRLAAMQEYFHTKRHRKFSARHKC
jgi:hypothetical protein